MKKCANRCYMTAIKIDCVLDRLPSLPWSSHRMWLWPLFICRPVIIVATVMPYRAFLNNANEDDMTGLYRNKNYYPSSAMTVCLQICWIYMGFSNWTSAKTLPTWNGVNPSRLSIYQLLPSGFGMFSDWAGQRSDDLLFMMTLLHCLGDALLCFGFMRSFYESHLNIFVWSLFMASCHFNTE